MLDANMHKVVLGLGFGDEGKGSVVDYLIAQHKQNSINPVIVVRFSGGQQAGHTVHLDNVSHVFSNFGSGTLRNVPTYWSKFCSFDPVSFMNEWNVLNEKGIHPLIYVDSECPITTPYDKFTGQKGKYILHGTCGTGFGPTLQREEDYYHLKVGDLLHPEVFRIKLQAIKDYYGLRLAKENMTDFYEAIEKVMDKILIRKDFLKTLPSHTFIFEGSQGLLLDQNHGFFPHVTRSNTGLKNVIELLSITAPLNIYLVTRAYSTRHGNGPFPTESYPIPIVNPYESNVSGNWQGEFKTGILNMDLINYALSCENWQSQNLSLVVTNLDVLGPSYMLLVKQKLVALPTEQLFLFEILQHMETRPNHVYINNSPYSKTMRKFLP